MEPTLNPTPPPTQPITNKFLKPKFIYIAFGIIILIEIVFGILSLRGGISSPTTKLSSQTAINDGSITLTSPSTKSKVGDNILVTVDISTGGNSVIGADLILHFDPTILSVSKESVIPEATFSTYPFIDADTNSGTIWVSAVNEGQKDFNGKGKLATITFTAKAKGSTTISVIYKDGDTKDSNLVSTKGVDILKQANNLNLEIN